jgi:hypothetical protein
VARDTRRKLSAIVKELAESVFRDPRAVPSSAAAHMALLLVHVAWNRALGQPLPEAQYRPMLEELEHTNPELWNELAENDVERTVDRLMALKQARYPQDDRLIQVCGMRGGNVHVEWYEGEDVREADAIATQHLARALELVMSGEDAAAVRHLCRTAGMSPREARQQVGKLRDVLRDPRP